MKTITRELLSLEKDKHYFIKVNRRTVDPSAFLETLRNASKKVGCVFFVALVDSMEDIEFQYKEVTEGEL